MAETVKITKALALRLLKEAVASKGADYVDPKGAAGVGCTYADGTRPGCIVGHVLYAAGVKPKVLRKLDNLAGATIDEASYVLEDDFGVTITRAAVRALYTAQMRQDRGATWGEALTEARHA